jgi:hypothetical protein
LVLVDKTEATDFESGFSPLTGIHWIGTMGGHPGKVRSLDLGFQSPDGDSLDWYSKPDPWTAKGFARTFQSPDGDSLDWYGDAVFTALTEKQGFSPLTGIHWIGTNYPRSRLCFGLRFQSPDGDSLDWYVTKAESGDMDAWLVSVP